MKTLLGFLALVLTFSSFAVAQESSGPLVMDGVDIRPLVEHYRKQVHVLTSPITIYDWSHSGAAADKNSSGLAERWAKTFWQMYGRPEGAGNMYGNGLYGAMDPESTYSYGAWYGDMSRNEDWLLIEMKLPVGFRMLDVTAYPATPPSKEILDLQSHFCQRTTSGWYLNGAVSLDSLFAGGGSGLPSKCQDLSRAIFKDILRIEGFAYSYAGKSYKGCAPNYSTRAFVITDSKWMTPELVHYYTSNTTDNLEGRTRLQTLFLKDVADRSAQNLKDPKFTKPIALYVSEHADSELKGSSTKCSGPTCVITVKFCTDAGACDTFDLPPLQRAGGQLITSEEALKTMRQKLLWPDLEGKLKTDSITTWTKENLYLCSGKTPYNE